MSAPFRAERRPARSPLRVVHISKVKGIAGSEGHLLRLLPGLARRGVDVRMVELVERGGQDGGFAEALAARGVEVEQVPIRPHFDPHVAALLVRRFRALQPDIVHTHLVHADLYGLWAARRAGVPSAVSSRHNTDRFRRHLAYRWLNRWSAPRADAIVAISEAVSRFTSAVEGVDRSLITTVHYGLDPEEIDPSARAEWRQRLGVALETPLAGVVARLVAQKGVDVLIDALPVVRAAVPGTRLAVAGDGELRGALEARAARLGLSAAVTFTGWIESAHRFMSACDVVVVPSRHEGFGLVALEAMAARRPIVATAVDALPEIVADGVTGLLVPPGNPSTLAAAIAGLLARPERASALGAAGYERLIECFSVDRMVAGTMRVYQGVDPRRSPTA